MTEWHDHFFGRKAALELLKKRVLDLKEGYRQNVALLGPRFIGKSSLIQKFISDWDDPTTISVYLNLENKDISYLYEKLVKSLLFGFTKIKNTPLQEDLTVLLEETRGALPQTVQVIEHIQQLLKQKKNSEVYQSLLSLPEIFAVETNLNCLLFIDEFHCLDNFDLTNPFQELGSKIMMHKRCLYVLASSYPEQAKQILSEKLSLLFGNFETVLLEPFDSATSQQLIGQTLHPLRIGMHLKSFLTDFTGGHPLYLNLITKELIYLSAFYKQTEVYVPLVAQAIDGIIFDSWGVLSRHFELLVEGLTQGKGMSMTSCLIALANGKNKVQDLVVESGLRQTQVVQKLNRLVETDLVEKNGNYFYLKDKLFRYWIKYVLQRRIQAVELEFGKPGKQFREEIHRVINEFQMSARKDLPMRVTELFHCFDNESIQLNGRRYKLPIFQEIIPIKMRAISGNYFDVIQAKFDEGTWLVVMKKESMTETDMNTFIQESKKLSPRPQRCVIVTLSDMDENTKVRLLQEKMWIWNGQELNTLMHVFDKPYIQ